MGIGLGFLGLENELDVIKEDIKIDKGIKYNRTLNRDLVSYTFPQRTKIILDFEYLSQSDVNKIQILENVPNPSLVYIPFSVTDYKRDITEGRFLTSTSSTPLIFNDYISLGTLLTNTELTELKYRDGDNYDWNNGMTDIGHYYHLLIKVDLGDFFNKFSFKKINRLSVGLRGGIRGYKSAGVELNGGNVYIFNRFYNAFYLLTSFDYRDTMQNNVMGVYFPDDKITESLPLHDQIFSDVDLYFLIISKGKTISSSECVTVAFDYLKVYINSYLCKKTNPFEFSYTIDYTGAGYSGTVELEEI